MRMSTTAVEAEMREGQRKVQVRLPQPLKLVGFYAGMNGNEDVGGKLARGMRWMRAPAGHYCTE